MIIMPKVTEYPFTLQLIITEECNLRCAYCFEIDKNPRTMSVELIRDILNKELSKPSDYEKFQIDLSGGEPFLHFDMLKEIVAYAVENAPKWKNKFYFFICSNLTLLTPEIKSWLEENKDFVVLGTSLDGTREAHNLYRNDSYDRVIENIPFYKKVYPQQGVKMTIGPETIKHIYDSIVSIESLGLTLSANVVYEPVWGDKQNKKEYLKEFALQLGLLIQHYVDNPELEVPSILTLPINILNTELEPTHSWCGSGKSMKAYDTDGRQLPCHRFTRFSTNKIYEGAKSIGTRIKNKCDSCNLSPACPHCPGYNWQVNGHPNTRTNNHCEFIKLQLLAAAKLVFLQNQDIISKLNQGNLEGIDEVPHDTLAKLQGAYFVMNELNQDKIIS